MLSLMLFFLLISALCLTGAVERDRKYEEMLPLSCSALVLSLYVTALLGLRRLGISVVICLSFLSALHALLQLLRKKRSWKAALGNFFTPGFFLYLLAFFYLAVLNYGRLCYEFDALSHWGDVVKAMVQTGALSTSPLTHSTFQSYLPGVSLFQYLSEEMNVLLGGGFAEWRLYHGFQVFVLAFLFPALKDLNFKKPWAWLCALALVLAPTFLFGGIYRFLYVDPVLGVLSASGLAAILLEKRRDGFYRARVLSNAAVLVLVKDAGLAFALIQVVLFLLAERMADGRAPLRWIREKWALCLAAAASLLLPWGLWKLSIRMNNAAVAFPGKVDLGQLLRILTFRDDSYRKTIRDLFLSGLIENASTASLLGNSLSYVLAFALILTAFLFISKRCIRRFPERAQLFRTLYWMTVLELILYMLGILIMYLFKFSEYEAMQLASMERYVAVPLLSVWLLTVLLAVGLIAEGGLDRNMLAALLLCTVLAGTPNTALQGLVNREVVGSSIAARQPITVLQEAFTARYQGAPAQIYFLSQEDTEYARFMAKFSLRPHTVSADLGWSLGEPFYEGDVWTRPCEPEALREELLAHYDFLMIHRMNEDFAERFGGLFEKPEDIGPDRIFAVNRESGLLELYAIA